MGITAPDLRFLLSAVRMGNAGQTLCMLGDQGLFFNRRDLHRTLRECNFELLHEPDFQTGHAGDDLFRAIGFAHIDVMDASNYEGANIIHDLNMPIRVDMHERYDMILDGGTLEHVFNFPMALENIMRMTKIGGDLLLTPPANNHCGHGFYQLSPELFFRVFVPENGFELMRIYMHTEGRSYHIADPAEIHQRVQLLNSRTALLMVHARKIAPVPLKLHVPQQSDYVVAWRAAERSTEKHDGPIKAFVRAYAPHRVVRSISRVRHYLRLKQEGRRWKKRSQLSNRKMYVPVRNWNIKTSHALTSKGPQPGTPAACIGHQASNG